MSNATKLRKPVKAAHGVCRWHTKPGGEDPAVLEINGTLYGVRPIEGGFELIKADGAFYNVALGGEFGPCCDCPDATFRPERPGGCKHQAALRAALKSIGQL